MLLRVVSMLLTCLLPAVCHAAVTTYYYSPEDIPGIVGRAAADGDVATQRLAMSMFGCTSDAVSQPITGWNLGDFTGVYSPAPLADHQRGIDNDWYGACAVQMCGYEYGAQLHTWSIPGGSGYNHDLANAQIKYKFALTGKYRPWLHDDSKLTVTFNLKRPTCYVEDGAIAYIYVSLLFVDEAGKYFWIQPQISDSRGAPNTEYVGWYEGTVSAYANTFFDEQNERRYCAIEPGSALSEGYVTWDDWQSYGFSISRTQLLAALQDINSRFSAGLSENPEDYQLRLFSLQDEYYWPIGNANSSFGIKDIYVYETHGPDLPAAPSGLTVRAIH